MKVYIVAFTTEYDGASLYSVHATLAKAVAAAEALYVTDRMSYDPVEPVWCGDGSDGNCFLWVHNRNSTLDVDEWEVQ